jgi:hypothetical protein
VPGLFILTPVSRQWPNGIVASNSSAPIPRDRTPTSTSTIHTNASITLITILRQSRSRAPTGEYEVKHTLSVTRPLLDLVEVASVGMGLVVGLSSESLN